MDAIITSEQIAAELEVLTSQGKFETQDSDSAFQEAASVLVYFEPGTLHAFGDKAPSGWDNYFSDCEPVRHKTRGDWWQLSEPVRIGALKRLETRERMLQALEANPDRTTDPAQKLYEMILRQPTPDIRQLKREEMVTALGFLGWLKDVLPVASAIASIQQAIPRADLLAPMRRLARDNFVGRKAELDRLAAYVGIAPQSGLFKVATRLFKAIFSPNLSEHPPVLIYGPGGVGKSTLLAKFILDTAGETDGLPFVYLDIDRAVINPEEPETFIIEAAHQLASQCPKQSVALLDLRDDTQLSAAANERLESSKSLVNWTLLCDRFGAIVQTIETPVLLAIDTFEEAQFLGAEVIYQLWSFLVYLQLKAPNLRPVVAGRAKVKEFPVQEVELHELSREEARQLLSGELSGLRLEPKALGKMVEDIIDVAGLNPLSLRLATAVVQNQDVKKLKTVETRNWLAIRIKSELIQARLYGRILAHVHDEDVKRLAYPGLIVRRITTDIIWYVLAEPCGIKLANIQEANTLMENFSMELSLVEPDPIDGALVHRQDVRRVMLKDLQNAVDKDIIRKIHEKAIAYYSQRADDISAAEEIYHLLFQDPFQAYQAESRWRPGLEPRLRNAFDELPDAGRLWLSRKLGVTPDPGLLRAADLQSWEQATARTAQRYLQTGNAKEALDVIRQRKDRSEASPLYRLELEALRYQGLYEEAAFVATELLSTIPPTAPPTIVREILRQMAFTQEALGNLEGALDYVKKIEDLLGSDADLKEQLRVYTTHIRLLRKMGPGQNEARAKLIELVRKMLSGVNLYTDLKDSPALLREMVAELGKLVPDLLRDAINRLGLEIQSDEQTQLISQALIQWNISLPPTGASALGEISDRLGVNSNDLDSWVTFIEKASDRSLSSMVQNLREEMGNYAGIANFDKTLVDIYRIGVDNAINRNRIQPDNDISPFSLAR